jgi:uncharacterized protein with PQ loop repeat
MSTNNLNNDDLEQQGKDFVNGRLYIYAAIANLFSGVYSFFILLFLDNFLSKFNKDKNYIRVSFIVFGIYFFTVYSILFYGIYTKEDYDDLFVEIFMYSLFLSLPISIYRFISFMFKFIKFKLNK